MMQSPDDELGKLCELVEEEQKTRTGSFSPGLADMMLLVLGIGLVFGLIRIHLQDPAFQLRLRSGLAVSFFTRVLLGHSMTAFGLVFGLSRFMRLVGRRQSPVGFGSYFWLITGLYLSFYLVASVTWAIVNKLRGAIPGDALFSILNMLKRVTILSSQQACFDSFAWTLAAIWVSMSILKRSVATAGTNDFDLELVPEKSDISFAVYSGFVVSSTCLQRLMESLAM